MLNNPLLPTAYLAPIIYYAILLQEIDCTLEQHEYFLKQSIRNRCEIYASNGKLKLTIPKKRQGISKTIISNVKISYAEKWQKVHWNTITSAYNSSPFFEYYKDKLEPFFKQKEVYLINFNSKLQEVILKILGIDREYPKSNEYNKSGNFTDLRNYTFKTKKMEPYPQVFMEKHGFITNLSILDLLFNLGPESTDYLNNIDTSIKIEEFK